MGNFQSDLNKAKTFSGVPFPTVSPNDTQQHPRSNNFPVTSATFSGLTSPSKGQPITIETYPLTLILFFFACSITGQNLFNDQSMEQFKFFCENDQVAEANTAIYFTPIYKAVSIPFVFGTRQGQETPQSLLMDVYSYLELAICGTHFGDTKDPTSTVLNPEEESLLTSLILSQRLTIFFQFWSPSRGPTSTIFINSPLLLCNLLAYCIRKIAYIQSQIGQFLYPGSFVHGEQNSRVINISDISIKISNHIQLSQNIKALTMDSEYSSITVLILIQEISIPRVKLSSLQKNTYFYEMDIATRWNKWHLEKKYTQFLELHRYLSKEFDNLPEFPESIIGTYLGQSESDVQQYRDILQDYMRITSLRKDIINSTFYSQFLLLAKHSQAILVNKPKFQGEFEIEQKYNDDGKVIIDMYYGQNYIIFATGNNSPLQKFNATIANTKFPWEDDQQAEFILPLGTIECWKLKKKPYGYVRVWARNYPIQVTKFVFSPEAQAMVVGLSDGSIQLFSLVPRGVIIYYHYIKTITAHEDAITGLYLDKFHMFLYSTSADGRLIISDARSGILMDTLSLNSEITGLYGQNQNNKLVVALDQGNMIVYEYNQRGRLKPVTTLMTPDTGNVKVMLMDRIKNYFFAGGYDSGSIYIFQLPKPGQQKFMKQVALLKNKPSIVSMHFLPDKMELIVACQSGEIFFWDCLKGKQIFMLRPFQQKGQIGKTHYLSNQKTLITAQRGRLVKFFQLPKQWRDTSVQQEQQRQIEIRRKVQNLHKVRQAIKRKQQDSDDDDIAQWYIQQQESSQEESWFNFV